MSIFKLTNRLLFRVSNAPQIVLEYADLKNGKDLTEIVEKAYGPQGNICSIKVLAFCLSMACLTILRLERLLCLRYGNSEAFRPKPSKNTKDHKSSIHWAGPRVSNSMKANTMTLKEVTT
jgi:hypothetical protein